MATRSTISIQMEDQSILQVYCHYDGYLEGVGKMLVEYYNTQEKVLQLICLGDISYLRKTIGNKHSFDERVENWSKFYGRDRGDTGTRARPWSSLEDYDRNGQFEEYNYMFKDGVWSCIGSEFKDWIDVEYELIQRDLLPDVDNV
jgi:hypothetical protein